MSLLLPFVLGALFGVVASMVLAYFLVRIVFLVRPPPSGTGQSFFRASRIGSVALIPPMFLVGFVLFSVMSRGMPLDTAHVSIDNQRLLWSLVLFGLLAQLVLGQRLSLVADSSIASRQRLVVERALSGAICNLARGDISSVDLYRPWFLYRDRRVELHLADGRAMRLFFGEDIQADLTTWLNQSH